MNTDKAVKMIVSPEWANHYRQQIKTLEDDKSTLTIIRSVIELLNDGKHETALGILSEYAAVLDECVTAQASIVDLMGTAKKLAVKIDNL